jgi:hypothetical protein
MQHTNRKTIKVKFTDFWKGFDCENSFFYKLLLKKYNVEISENPDLLFFSCYSNNHQKYNCVKIFYTGENVRPDFGACDFSFSFDYLNTNRNYRLPLYALYDDVNKLINRQLNVAAELKKKQKFCCFVVSNSTCLERNNFFTELSKCKLVDSGGVLFNNIGGTVDNKREFIRQYKFVIAFENSSYPGYVTEKIFEPLLEDCVPIYWGTELVTKDFNPKRFINCHDFESFDKVIDHVLKIDEDDEAYSAYLSAPAFIDDKLPPALDNENISKQLDVIVAYSQQKSLKKIGVQTLRPYTLLAKNIFNRSKAKLSRVLTNQSKIKN